VAGKKGAYKAGSSREEVEQRIAHIRTLLVTGEWNEKTRYQIARKLAEQWAISQRMVRDYAHRARRDIDSSLHVDVKELEALRQLGMARAEMIYSGAMKRNSFMAATAAMELWCKIAGVDELGRRKDQREAEKHAREMGSSDVREVRLIIEEAQAAPKDDGGPIGA